LTIPPPGSRIGDMRSSIMSLLAVTVFALSISCAGAPPPPAEEVVSVEQPAPEALPFDPSSISPQVKLSTMEDVKSFISEVNQVIRKKDYSTWRGYLTEEYAVYYSDASVLAEISESSVLKRQGIALKSLQDYFLFVVYPARQSVRVDDIEFTSPVQVKAVTVAPSGDRQVYYYLEKVGESWKIGTGR